MPVTRFALVRKIGCLKPNCFGEVHYCAFDVCCFLAANNLVHRVATHTAQRPPDEVCEDAKLHLVLAVPKCVGPTCHQRFILNMDQSNSKFGKLPGQTINQCGACTINMRIGTNHSKCCTVALTMSFSGKMLTPMVIYKGEKEWPYCQLQDLQIPKEWSTGCS